MSANPYNTNIEQYHAERQPTDIDLVAEVRQSLISAGLSHEVIQAYDNNHYILDASNRTPEVQRHLLNRFWNLQLLSCPSVSIDERYCLIPNGSVVDWLRLFRERVLPFAIANRLPVIL